MAEVRDASIEDVPKAGRSTLRVKFEGLLESERFRWWVVYVMLAGLAAAKAGTTTERDPYWSARAGAENLGGTSLIREDTWSWSAEGVWYPNSPGWNLVLGLGWQSFGFWGLFVAGFAAIALMLGLALVISRLAGAGALPTLIGFAALLPMASSGLSARATVVVQCLLFGAALFAWWWGGVVGRIQPSLAILGVGVAGLAVSLLGNWVHLSFMLMAGVVAVMWAVAWWATPGIRTAQRLCLVASGTVGLLLGCVLSPYGIALTLERSRVVESVCRELISEWMSVPTYISLGMYQVVLPVVLLLGVGAASIVWISRLVRQRGRFDPRVRLLLPLTIIGVLFSLVGVHTVRFLFVGAILLLPVAACAITSFAKHARRRQLGSEGFWGRRNVIEFTSGRFLIGIALFVALVTSPVVGAQIGAGSRPPEAEVIEKIPVGCTTWSQDRAAGPIILMRPDVKVWIDGRVDFYGRAHFIEYVRILSGLDPLPKDAGCVVLPTALNERPALADLLDRDPVWSRVTERNGYALWVRG